MLIPVCRATDTMPRHTTLLPAIPSRTDSRSRRPHIRHASRARVPGVTRADGSQWALLRFATSMKHRSIIREPYQAHASHKAARTGSSYALGRVSVFVSVRRFGEGVSALFVFSQRIRLNGSDVPHACILFVTVRFLVCCATFALSVGLLFSTRIFFSGHVSSNAL